VGAEANAHKHASSAVHGIGWEPQLLGRTWKHVPLGYNQDQSPRFGRDAVGHVFVFVAMLFAMFRVLLVASRSPYEVFRWLGTSPGAQACSDPQKNSSMVLSPGIPRTTFGGWVCKAGQ
jgi:hypothetical protein